MEIRLHQVVKAVKIELNIEEAMAFLAKPDHVQDEVRSMLKGGGVGVPEDGAASKKSHHAQPRKQPRVNDPRIECEECHRMITKSIMPRHMRTKHGG